MGNQVCAEMAPLVTKKKQKKKKLGRIRLGAFQFLPVSLFCMFKFLEDKFYSGGSRLKAIHIHAKLDSTSYSCHLETENRKIISKPIAKMASHQ